MGKSAVLSFDLLGGFVVSPTSGNALTFPTRKAELLLAYLAIHPGQPISREKLMALLWSDRGEEQARGSLRQTLTIVRQVLDGLDPSPLVTDRDSVRIEESAIIVDATEFEHLADSTSRTDLEHAVALYKGPFMDGAAVRDPAFEGWLTVHRERLRETALRTLARLSELQADAGRRDEAISTCRRLLELDPLREDTHRALIRLFALNGERGLAIRQYESCHTILRQELGVAPDRETLTLYESLFTESAAASKPSAAWSDDRPDSPEFSEGPTVAVLPFENLSGDPEQEYFADGITEDIIAALSHWRSFPVIGRNSTMPYKGRAIDPAEVAKDLGVQYLVAGSVRKAGQAVRSSVQLIDTLSGRQCWAHRYDVDLSDIFSAQDEVTERIVASIEPEIQEAEQRRALLKRPNDLTAWDHMQRATRAKEAGGKVYGTKEGNSEAERHLRAALALDPTSGQAMAMLARCAWHTAIQGWSDDAEKSLAESLRLARQAVALDDGNWQSHGVLGIALLFGHGDVDSSLAMLKRAVALNPSAAVARHGLGCGLEFAGRPAEAILQLEAVFRLDPRYRLGPAALSDLTTCHFLLGDFEMAISYGRRATSEAPDYIRGHQRLAAVLGAAGQLEEARAVLGEVMSRQPSFSVAYVTDTYPFSNPDHRDMFVAGLRKAGLEGKT